MSEPSGRLRVTWTKSAIGYAENQKRTIAALGLRRLHQSVEHDDTAAIRGMVMTVAHLVHAEDATASRDRNRSGGSR
ncbi:MAG: 50S ribosomal protein L30 [Candidatus Dormibacteraeota bacterium]|nr:50S ribosomal protein L30 [Candidatus Dormibacteraeota bacterium]